MRIGCCLPGGSFMPQGVAAVDPSPLQSLRSGYQAVREMGYDYIEITVARLMELSEAELAEAADAYRSGAFRVEVCNSFIPGRLPLLGAQADHAAIRAYLQDALRRMELVGVEYVVFGSGAARHIPDEMDPAQAQAELDAFLTEAESIARVHGVTIVIEPLNKSEDNAINTVPAGAAIVRRLNLPNLKLLADAYHMYREDEPLTVLVENEDILRHVHVAEPPDRLIPNRAGGDYLRTFGAVLGGTPYSGRVTIECRYEDFASDVRMAYPFMREVF